MRFLSMLKYVNIDEIMNFYFENQHSTAAPPDDLELNIQKYKGGNKKWPVLFIGFKGP